MFVSSCPNILWRRITAYAGFPIDVDLIVYPLNSNLSDFEFVLTDLPEHGAIFSPDEEPLRMADFQDLYWTIFPPVIHYVGMIGYTGPDSFQYATRPIGYKGAFTDFTTVLITVVPVPSDGCIVGRDKCGVCGGDGKSCTSGGCDGKGGKLDECGICGGDGSTCTCESYKTFTTDELSCILFEHSINKTLSRIDYAVNTLLEMLDRLYNFKSLSADLLLQIEHLCSIEPCLADYFQELAIFELYLDEALEITCSNEPSEFDPTVPTPF
jgi:hypothetical protein